MMTKVNILKNVVQCTAIALCMAIFASCEKEPNDDASNISMTVPPDEPGLFSIAGTGTVSIDWGDGTVETKTLQAFSYDRSLPYDDITYMFTHSYSSSSSHTIRIDGNNITHLTIGRKLVESTSSSKTYHSINLTNLDVSRATALKALDCWGSKITELNLNSNKALVYLDCSQNFFLKKLDLRNNTALTYLDCVGSEISELNLNANTALTYLQCSYNKLTNLDLSNNPALTDLICYNNQFTNLDLSANTALTTLHCDNNQLMILDFSNNTMLLNLYCHSNNLSTSALNAMFVSLPNTTLRGLQGVIYAGSNSGSNDCDKSIAEVKGWIVYNDLF